MSVLYPCRTIHSYYFARGSQTPGKTGFKEEYSFTVFTPYPYSEQAITEIDGVLEDAASDLFQSYESVQHGEEDNRRVSPEQRTAPYWHIVFQYQLIRNGALVESRELGRYGARPRYGKTARKTSIGQRMVEALHDIFSAIE